MKLSTMFHYSAPDDQRWSAIDEDNYDGAIDTPWEGKLQGWGATEREAIEDLVRLLRECAEAEDEQQEFEADPAQEWLDDMHFNNSHSWGKI